MILGLLSLPFRLLGLLLLVGVGYVAWVNRTELRRIIHRVTAEPEAPPPVSPTALAPAKARGTKKLDSLSRGQADSVVLSREELVGLVAEPVRDRIGNAVDSLDLALGDGTVTLSGRVNPAELPKGSLGPLADWIAGSGPQAVEAKGTLTLRRVGVAELGLSSLTVRGLPVPKAVWSRLLPTGSDGVVEVPVESWVTGVRVTRQGMVLYGAKPAR